jgi:putative ABC transport system permease protein
LLLTQVVLVAAGSSFLMVLSLNSSIALTMDRIFARNRYDALIGFAQNERLEHVASLSKSLGGVEEVELHLVQSASLFKEGQLVKEAGLGTSLEGVPAGSDFFKPVMVAGRWFLPGDGRVIVIPRETARKNQIEVGNLVTLDLGDLGEGVWQVVGVYDPIFAGGLSTDRVYVPLESLYRSTKKYNQGSLLYVRTTEHDGPSTAALTSQLKDVFDSRGLKVTQSITQTETRRSNGSQFDIVVWMMMALSVIVALVGGIALMGALSIGVIERTKEIGVMRAVGARSRTILGIFIMEGLFQGFLSWLIALPLSMLTSPLLARGLGQTMFGANLDYQYNWGAVGMWLIFIMVISALASIVPASRATRISVRDSLAYA